MFSRLERTDIPELKNLGCINFHTDTRALNLLVKILIEAKNLNGNVLNAGEHTLEITTNDATRLVNFKLYESCRYRGVMDFNNQALLQSELFNLIARDVKEKGYLCAGAHLASPDRNARSDMHEIYFLPFHIKHRIAHGVDYYDIYEANDKRVGDGAFGKVYSPAGTVKPAFSVIGSLIYSPGREKRATKVLDRLSSFDLQKSIYYYECELNTMRKVGLFDIRDAGCMDIATQKILVTNHLQAFFINKSSFTISLSPFFSMRYFHGLNMEKIFDSDNPRKKPAAMVANGSGKSGPASLFKQSFLTYLHTLPSLLSVIDGLLFALKYDYAANGVIHGDIKIDHLDVMVDPVSFGMWVKILDHGFSFNIVDKAVMARMRRESIPGTPLYMSPSVLNGVLYSMADDWYAAAVCIGFLLGDSYLSGLTNLSAFTSSKFNSQHVNFKLGNGRSLPVDSLNKLRDILFGMTKHNSNERLSNDVSIRLFREVAHDYFLQQTNDEAEKCIISDHFAMGCHLRAKLDVLCVRQASRGSFADMKEAFTSAVCAIEDNPLAIAAFSQVVNVARLMNCKNKATLLTRIATCFNQYEQALNELDAIKMKLRRLAHGCEAGTAKANELSAYLTYVDKADAKQDRYRCRFEHMLLITERVQDKVVKLTRALAYFGNTVPAITTHHSLDIKSVDPFQNRLRF